MILEERPLVKREIMLLTLCALFVAYTPFVNYQFDASHMSETIMNAYGQTPGPSDPGNTGGLGDPGNSGDPGNTGSLNDPGNPGGLGGSNPDLSAGDNLTNPSNLGDNSTNPSNLGDISSVMGNSTNDMTQNDTSNGPNFEIASPNNVGNPTTTQAVPEFPIAMFVMIIAIGSTVALYKIKSLKI